MEKPQIIRVALPQEVKEQLEELILEGIERAVLKLKKQSDNKEQTALMSLKETARFFDVSLVTIHQWRKTGHLPPSIKQGGKVFFKRTEIEHMLNTKKGGLL